jgi:melibiose permease/lactose/raffinose/galactose permease
MTAKKSFRNSITFGVGTIGRDMVYTLISMYLIFYLTDIVRLPAGPMGALIGISVAIRVFDAINDPFMGVIVDNTKTRWGKFKPWIAIGTALSAVTTLLIFSGLSLTGWGAVAFFGISYVLWEISYTINDISYWSMLPALSLDKGERERIGSIARICANIGLFFSVAAIVPLTDAFGARFGGPIQGWFAFALLAVTCMVIGQVITLAGVKSPSHVVEKSEDSTSLRDMLSVILKNDSLHILPFRCVYS